MNDSRPAPRASSREIDLLIVIYLAVIVFSILYPATFFSWQNARAILNNLAADGIVAVGMMMLMIGVVTGGLLMHWRWPVFPAVVAGGALAALAGWVNGMLVAKARVNALITT